MITFHVISIFPEVIAPYVHSSILGRAEKKGIVKFNLVNLRDFSSRKYKKVDDVPYGGGAGMVLMAEPILKAVDALRKGTKSRKKTKVVLFSAKGKQFDQKRAYDWAKRYDHIVLIAGRYEGIDERVKNILKAEEISVGHYVLTDGDVAAMAVISAVARLVPGVIKLESLEEESHWNLLRKGEKGVLGASPAGEGVEYPHYTRPETLVYRGKKFRVPKVLLSGHHARIKAWRRKLF